jgi:hypothetical protein
MTKDIRGGGFPRASLHGDLWSGGVCCFFYLRCEIIARGCIRLYLETKNFHGHMSEHNFRACQLLPAENADQIPDPRRAPCSGTWVN